MRRARILLLFALALSACAPAAPQRDRPGCPRAAVRRAGPGAAVRGRAAPPPDGVALLLGGRVQAVWGRLDPEPLARYLDALGE